MPHTALEDCDPAIPPCDSLAEAIVLQVLLAHPENLAAHDVRPLLVFPEHRVCLDAMKRAYAATPAPWGRFYLVWLDELERACPGRGAQLEALLNLSAESESEWRWTRYDEDSERWHGRPLRAADYSHDWQWWLDRLKRIAEARRLIASAQEMAERAWRCDVDGAAIVAVRAARGVPRVPVRVDV